MNIFSRQFTDEETDLVVKVPGGHVPVRRYFNGWEWQRKEDRDAIQIQREIQSYEDHNEIVAENIYTTPRHPKPPWCPLVDKAKQKRSSLHQLYLSTDFDKITRIDFNLYKRKQLNGDWTTHDYGGRLLSFGTLQGTVGTILYDIVEAGVRPIGIADRNGEQVIWYEYNDDAKLSAIYDVDNRRVEYFYTDGLLTRVVDSMSNETTYEYNSHRLMVRKTDAAGRDTIVTYNSRGDVSSVVDNQGTGHFFEYSFDKQKEAYYASTRSSSGMVKEVWFDSRGDTKTVSINGDVVLDITKEKASANSTAKTLYLKNDKGRVTQQDYDENGNLKKSGFPPMDRPSPSNTICGSTRSLK